MRRSPQWCWALLLCSIPVPLTAQFQDPGTGRFVGLSDLVQMDAAGYLAVIDAKSFEEERRVAIVTVNATADLDFDALAVADWKDPAGRASDLEAACRLPGTDDFLLFESGNWQGRPGRIFRAAVTASPSSISIKSAVRFATIQPNGPGLRGDQYEGAACTPRSDGKVLIILGERGGSRAFPNGVLRWMTYDPVNDTIDWPAAGRTGVTIGALDGWLDPNRARAVGALYLDPEGVLWSSAVEDNGDNGPFRSVVYPVAYVHPDERVPVVLTRSTRPRWIIEGQKVEGLAGTVSAFTHTRLVAATENEQLGGSLTPLFLKAGRN